MSAPTPELDLRKVMNLPPLKPSPVMTPPDQPVKLNIEEVSLGEDE